MAILNLIFIVVFTAIGICSFVGFVIFLIYSKKCSIYYQDLKDLKDLKEKSDKQMFFVVLFLSIALLVVLRVFAC